MCGYWGWSSGWFFGMHLLWWLFWALVVVALWRILVRAKRPAREAANESPIDVLKRRYADGAMGTAEYEERLAKLRETEPMAH